MTEFHIGDTKLGLMPATGIQKILGSAVALDSSGTRCELYLDVDDPALFGSRAIAAGARELSALAARNWGDDVVYLADPDNHVIAFARKTA